MEFATLKNLIGILAIILTFVGYAPYLRDLVRGKTKPHVFSWLVWTLTTAIIFALQLNAGGGLGSFVTLAVALISLTVFVLSLRRGEKDIKSIDVAFLVLALIAIPLWLVIKQPVLSILILTGIDILGFAPTIRKSWNAPYSETLSTYQITGVRHALSIIALAQYNIVTMLFPGIWVIANVFFSIMLVLRRRRVW